MVYSQIQDKEATVLPIGKKAVDSFRNKGIPVLTDSYAEAASVGIGDCFSIAKQVSRAFLDGQYDEDSADGTLPELAEGQSFDNPAAKVTEHDTTPPKPHNEASLLSAMERAGNEDTDPDAERKGLGTPATRAAVIEKLVSSGFVERKGKQLIPTKDGNNLVCILPDNLTSPKLTAEWENNLTQIAKGAADPNEFLSGIEAMARELVKSYPFLSDSDKERFKTEKPEIGKCPRCGSPVHEGKKNYYCSDRDCAFVMWKNDRFFEDRKVTFSPKIAAALLKSGKVKHTTNMCSAYIAARRNS